jgi:DnaJ like chaperone protein
MFIGKVIGALLGYLAGRWIGAIIGLIAGHYFDKGFSGVRAGARQGGQQVPLAEHPFFATVFTVMGALAKADGRISEQEIAGAERIMAELGLDGAARSEAIALFKRGAAADFQLEPQIALFLRKSLFQPELKQMLVEYLAAFALADGELHGVELDILQRTATYLGFDRTQFLQLLDMLQAQQHFHQQPGSRTPSVDEVADAYRAQGVPENMVKLATEKAQEIQAAYALIEKARKR